MKKCILTITTLFLSTILVAQTIPYTNCTGCWDADSLGNHRVIVDFIGTGKVAFAKIPWRRRDENPQLTRIIVQDKETGKKINNVATGNINRELGNIFFEPISGKGTYYIYYLPYKNEGSANYPKSVYLSPDSSGRDDWFSEASAKVSLENTVVTGFQSIDSFNSFYPMEVIATQDETAGLISGHANDAFLVFPEYRLHSIRMKKDLPYRWIAAGPRYTFTDTARKGENFAFQLGVFALENIRDLQVSFSDLVSATGHKISGEKISCLNTGGTTYDGRPLKIQLGIKEHEVQPLWCMIQVPENISAGIYKGVVKLKAANQENAVKDVRIQIVVLNEPVVRHGADEPWKMTRLSWMNSKLAQENKVIPPYTPLQVQNHTIRLLGRRFQINDDGLPKSIETFFTPEMTSIGSKPNNIISEPFRFIALNATGKEVSWKREGTKITSASEGTVTWKARSTAPSLTMDVNGSLEFDGFVSYSVKITATENIALSDIRLDIPVRKEAADYMMGLGHKGGNRPENLDWKWDVAQKNQDGAWIGSVNAGMQFSLRDEKYVRPLNTNFYLQKPLLLPSSWGNEGNGGIRISENERNVMVQNYSGPRTLKKGDVLYYNFTLLITPFHTLQTDFQWKTRFFHAYKPIDSIKATGASIINIHHGTAINPWINYPFIAWQKMKNYIDSAHKAGLKVKIYNTVRELSNHAYETFALKSLGHEIYSPGKGGGFSWLQEHLDSDYIAAWFVPEVKDAAIINSGMNRWHNYYVEGMNWLTQQVGIDGIYLDDVAFDRITMKRIKRVLTKDGHPGIIDLHSANQYNARDGFNNSANLYLEHFPYLNRLWFGEYFDYENEGPDFFMTEVSGIPFGLMGEMLQGGGNPYRGMVYGMTNRMPWSDNADPRPIWKVWDDFGIQGSEMIGYWVKTNPIKITGSGDVLATIYRKEGKVLISIASWAKEDAEVRLDIDWAALKMNPANAILTGPEVKNFQPSATFKPGESIPVQKGKGWLLILK